MQCGGKGLDLEGCWSSLNSILMAMEKHWKVLSREYHDLKSSLLVCILLQLPLPEAASMPALLSLYTTYSLDQDR